MKQKPGVRLPAEIVVIATAIARKTVAGVVLPDARTGDVADRTITTPVELTVVKLGATSQARQRAAAGIPPLFRFDARAFDQAADRFLNEFDQRQTLFENVLCHTWPNPPVEEARESRAFLEYVAAIGLAHPGFPLSDDLAWAWARGSGNLKLRDRTVSAIRQTDSVKYT